MILETKLSAAVYVQYFDDKRFLCDKAQNLTESLLLLFFFLLLFSFVKLKSVKFKLKQHFNQEIVK